MLKSEKDEIVENYKDSFMDCMQIRYIRLHFELELIENGDIDTASLYSDLPEDETSGS